MLRKIDAMHNEYGVINNKCKYCCNLRCYKANKTWYKCEAYGISNSEATDWKKNNIACGRFNIPFMDKEIPLIKKLNNTACGVDYFINGQIEIGDF